MNQQGWYCSLDRYLACSKGSCGIPTNKQRTKGSSAFCKIKSIQCFCTLQNEPDPYLFFSYLFFSKQADIDRQCALWRSYPHFLAIYPFYSIATISELSLPLLFTAPVLFSFSFGTTESTEAYAMYPCRRCKVGHLVPSISQCVDQGGPPGVRLMHWHIPWHYTAGTTDDGSWDISQMRSMFGYCLD